MPTCTQASTTYPECLFWGVRVKQKNFRIPLNPIKSSPTKQWGRAGAERHRQEEPGTKEPLSHKGMSSSE